MFLPATIDFVTGIFIFLFHYKHTFTAILLLTNYNFVTPINDSTIPSKKTRIIKIRLKKYL